MTKKPFSLDAMRANLTATVPAGTLTVDTRQAPLGAGGGCTAAQALAAIEGLIEERDGVTRLKGSIDDTFKVLSGLLSSLKA